MAAGFGAYFGPSLFHDEDHFVDIDLVSGTVSTAMNRAAGTLPELMTEAEEPRDPAAGENLISGPSRTSRALRGWLADNFAANILFNQIYVEIVNLTTTPPTHHGQEYDAGFITEDISLTVLIWNAYLTANKDFTAVTVSNPDGTTITYPTLPLTLSPNSETQCTLVIAQDGPAVQDTAYRFTVGGVTEELTFDGIRVLAVLPEPNWQPGIIHTYSFHTAMFQTERFAEQRRSLIEEPLHSQSQEYLVLNSEAKKFFYNLSYGHDKVFAVPIYNEMMLPTDTGVPQSGTTITLSGNTDPDDMWNLNNGLEYIVILDHANGMSEIKEVSSISSPTITVTQAIVNDFDEATTRIYPVFFGLIKAAALQQRSDGIDTVKLDFLEFTNG